MPAISALRLEKRLDLVMNAGYRLPSGHGAQLFTGAGPHLLQVSYKLFFRSVAQITFLLNFGK
jgi:hypothetical protein